MAETVGGIQCFDITVEKGSSGSLFYCFDFRENKTAKSISDA